MYGMIDLLYDIYYGTNKYTYFVPKKLKPFFDAYIINNCQFLKEFNQNGDFSLLVYNFRFEYDKKIRMYKNIDEIELIEKKEKYIEKESNEEWNYICGEKYIKKKVK